MCMQSIYRTEWSICAIYYVFNNQGRSRGWNHHCAPQCDARGAWHPATTMCQAGRIDILTSCIMAGLPCLLFSLKPYIQQTSASTGLLLCPMEEWFWDTHMPVCMPDYTFNILCRWKLNSAFFTKLSVNVQWHWAIQHYNTSRDWKHHSWWEHQWRTSRKLGKVTG